MRAPSSTLNQCFSHTGEESHLLRELVRTNQAFMSRFGPAVGISASRFAIMRQLAICASEGAGTSKLARQLGINAAAVTRLVQELERAGLVVRRADAGDGRRTYFRLSAKGVRAFKDIHRRGHDLERSLSSIMDAGEMATAIKVLGRLRVFLETLA